MNYTKDYLRWLFYPSKTLDKYDNRIFDIKSWEPIHFVSDHNVIGEIHKATGDVFLGGGGNEFLISLLGEQSVFILDGDNHKMARKVLSKCFTSSAVGEMENKLVSHINQFFGTALSKRSVEFNVGVRWLAFLCVKEMIAPDMKQSTSRALFNKLENATGITSNYIAYNKKAWRDKGPLSLGRIVKTIKQSVDEIIYAEISRSEQSGRNNRSLMDVLISEKDKYSYDYNFIRDNVVSAFAAGYDTTGAALSWLCYWFSRIDGNTRDELKSELLDDKSESVKIRYFINEILRISPPIEILPRKISESHADAARSILDKLNSSIDMEPVLVAPCPFKAHRDPGVFSDPMQFDPKRFSTSKYSKAQYFPYGGGSRYCLGHTLGNHILEKFLIALIKNDFGIEIRLKYNSSPIRKGVTLWPALKMYGSISTCCE